MNGRADGDFLGILSTLYCLDPRGVLRLFCLYFEIEYIVAPGCVVSYRINDRWDERDKGMFEKRIKVRNQTLLSRSL